MWMNLHPLLANVSHFPLIYGFILIVLLIVLFIYLAFSWFLTRTGSWHRLGRSLIVFNLWNENVLGERFRFRVVTLWYFVTLFVYVHILDCLSLIDIRARRETRGKLRTNATQCWIRAFISSFNGGKLRASNYYYIFLNNPSRCGDGVSSVWWIIHRFFSFISLHNESEMKGKTRGEI